MRALLGCLVLAASLGVSQPVHAALTDSEKAQIQGFVRSGDPKNAGRIRALTARPDLTAEEAAEPLAAGFAAVPFDDRREQLAREILLGPGSVAARSELVAPLVSALLARASAALAAMPASESGPEAVKADRLAAEIVRVHRFVTDVIANAGRPPPDGHDAAAGIHDDALRRAVELYRAHFERHAAVLRPGTRLSPSLVPVRAQASLAVVDLSRGLLGRHEVSALLGLTGSKKALFERHGTLLEDGGTASEERLAQVTRFLDVAPRAASGLSLWLVSKAPARELGARGARAAARVSLGSSAGPPLTAPLWPADVEPSRPDRELAEVAYSAAWVVVRAALKANPALARTAGLVATRAARAGAEGQLAGDLDATFLPSPGAADTPAHATSAEYRLAHALRLVLLDAPRALDLALARASAGREEPLAAFVLAVSALAATGGSADEIGVGRTEPGGEVTATALTQVATTNGLVSAFELEGKKVTVRLGSDGQVDGVQVDGAPPRLSKLTRVRLSPKPGDAWMAGATRWEKLGGAPRGLGVDDGRFVLAAGEQSEGFDAVVTGGEEKDATLSARVKVKARGGGLLVRGQVGEKSYDGIALLVSVDPTPRATLILVDGKARATELAPPVELPPAGPEGYQLVLSAKGTTVTGTVDGKKIVAKLRRGVGSGRNGLMVLGAGHIEVSDFARGAPRAAKKANAERTTMGGGAPAAGSGPRSGGPPTQPATTRPGRGESTARPEKPVARPPGTGGPAPGTGAPEPKASAPTPEKTP